MWATVYDYSELEKQIKELRDGSWFVKQFYEPQRQGQPSFCQGDVIRLETAMAFLDEDGQPVAGRDRALWLVLGNSCDLDRDLSDVPWTQLLPVDALASEKDVEMLPDLRAYRTMRQFFLPTWGGSAKNGYFADFLRPVSANRNGLEAAAVQARLSYTGWLLFHACLVRYLARADGRNDF